MNDKSDFSVFRKQFSIYLNLLGISTSGSDQQIYISELQRIFAISLALEMMPDINYVVKGGSMLASRYPVARFTKDLDIASGFDPYLFEERYSENLRIGWGDFKGNLINTDRDYDGDTEYDRNHFDVKLNYKGYGFSTVSIDYAHNELGSADQHDNGVHGLMVGFFNHLGLDNPTPALLMMIPYQIAQKIHSVTDPGTTLNPAQDKRIRDLIDLQLIVAQEDHIDYAEVKELCLRTFRYRQDNHDASHTFPPSIRSNQQKKNLYGRFASDINTMISDGKEICILPYDEALRWFDDFVAKIEEG